MILAALALALTPLADCRAVDGDTLACHGERIRVQAIQASDRPTSQPCRAMRRGYVCDLALYEAGKARMADLLRSPRIAIVRTGHDRYGRTTGHVYADGRLVACIMLREGLATYWREYDRDGFVRLACAA